MIADLLPRYYQVFDTGTRYEVIRSIMIDDHEVAWMSYTGTIQHDITGQGREGNSFTGRAVYCECDFTEGVGWQMNGDQPSRISTAEQCPARTIALEQRHSELRKEYEKEFGAGPDGFAPEGIDSIIMDLIKKEVNGEWIENSNGAHFWGGHFYFQTVASILGLPEVDVADVVYAMVDQQKIDLDGDVVKTYTPPPAPEWEDCFKVEMEGWTAKALLPVHSRMPQEWKFEVWNPEGQQVTGPSSSLRLTHQPVFGPDADDVAAAEYQLLILLDHARNNV